MVLYNHPEFVVESLVNRGKDMLTAEQLTRFNELTKDITDIYKVCEELESFLQIVSEEECQYFINKGYELR